MRRFYLAFVSVETSETASRKSGVTHASRKLQTASAISPGVAPVAAAPPPVGESLQTVSAASRLSHAAAHFRLPWSAYVRLLSVRSEEARHFYEAEALRGGWSVRQLARQIDSQFYERNALSRNKASVLKKGTWPLPDDVCFVGRQKRLRIGDEWFRVDLIFFHRSLRCLVLIDLKLGRFTHADVGQMDVYL